LPAAAHRSRHLSQFSLPCKHFCLISAAGMMIKGAARGMPRGAPEGEAVLQGP
jgi:hypothetical protein